MDYWENIDPTLKVDDDFMKKIAVSQKWYSQIPRDRQSLVNELLSRLGANGISLEKYLDEIGDVENTEEEKELIIELMQLKKDMAAKPEPSTGDPLSSSDFSRQNESIDSSQ